MAKTADLIRKLLTDHQDARDMFARIESAPADQVGELFWEMTHALVRHDVHGQSLVRAFGHEKSAPLGVIFNSRSAWASFSLAGLLEAE